MLHCLKRIKCKFCIPNTTQNFDEIYEYLCNFCDIANIGRSEKPAKGQIICQRTDYLSFYRFTNLLNSRLKLSDLIVC